MTTKAIPTSTITGSKAASKGAKYTDTGNQFEKTRKSYQDKAHTMILLSCLCFVAGTMADYMVFKDIVDRVFYTDSAFANTFICGCFSAVPISLAWLLAFFTTKIMNKATRRLWHVAVFALSLVALIVFLGWACQMRLAGLGESSADNEIMLSWGLNILAIIIAITCYVIKLILELKREEYQNLADKNQEQLNYTEAHGEVQRYIKTSHADDGRRAKAHTDCVNTYIKLADAIIDALDRSREICLEVFKPAGELHSQVLSFPYNIAGKAYADREGAKAALLKVLEAPSHDEGGRVVAPSPNRLLNTEAASVANRYNERYQALVNRQKI